MEPKYDKPILRTAYHMIYYQKGNCMIGITGSVNTGKSHMGIKLGYEFDSKFKIEESLVYGVENLLERSLSFIKFKGKPLSIEDFKKIPNVNEWLKENIKHLYITPGKVIIMDETGALGAYVREFFSLDNRTLSKIIQIWRILRMMVIFIVPEDISLAESTITRFLNLEIKMTGIDQKKNVAECIAWKYTGWNKKSRSRYRQRLKGCRWGGHIEVKPLPQDIANAYEDFSRSEKIAALVNMGKEYLLNKPINVGQSKTIWDDIEYVRENLDKFKNDKGKITVSTIQTHLGISRHKAAQVSQSLTSEEKGSTPTDIV